ncbi:carbohydrate esterase family 4 protein [Aulographum hederae CBS 113979]|uniref:chitin deacetylase n=1 Tax=Aulographum hederae CBS 113979 TaxID=1176131 RepID=A0A6G1HBW5_9PEZI|nr:carbohydrate esterase family 4 protein [Aulographum hederae CBS 113979]
MFLLISVVLIFVTPFYIIYKPPNILIRYFSRRWPDVLWQVDVPNGEKFVALSIDDAPSEYTEEILKILEENDAHATFFVIGGQAPGREDMLRKVVRGGNELGNHAMRDEPSRALSDSALEEQILAVEKVIQRAYTAEAKSVAAKYFRPGSGFFSDRMRKVVAELGYKLVLGSIYPHDPQINLWRVNAQHILSMLRPGGIIICHDRRSWTVPMLQKVVPEMKRRGYRIVTISDLQKEAKT